MLGMVIYLRVCESTEFWWHGGNNIVLGYGNSNSPHFRRSCHRNSNCVLKAFIFLKLFSEQYPLYKLQSFLLRKIKATVHLLLTVVTFPSVKMHTERQERQIASGIES